MQNSAYFVPGTNLSIEYVRTYHLFLIWIRNRSAFEQLERNHLNVNDLITNPFWPGELYMSHRTITSLLQEMACRRHQMETFSALLALCAGNSPATGEFPAQRPVTRSVDIFFYLRRNKRLSKQPWGWWFETPSVSLWRHWNGFRRCHYLHQWELTVSWALGNKLQCNYTKIQSSNWENAFEYVVCVMQAILF